MSSPEQKEEDCKYLSSALSAGPRRYEQMIGEIYDIYRRWGFDAEVDTPISVLEQLQGIYRVQESSAVDSEPF